METERVVERRRNVGREVGVRALDHGGQADLEVHAQSREEEVLREHGDGRGGEDAERAEESGRRRDRLAAGIQVGLEEGRFVRGDDVAGELSTLGSPRA